MKKQFIANVAGRVILSFLVVALGIFLAGRIVASRKPPEEVRISERPVRVALLEVVRQDVPVVLSGWGDVRARDIVTLAPEVAGRVVSVHANLEVGETIRAGDTLFQIDRRDYLSRVTDAEANVQQQSSAVERLRKQNKSDEARLLTYERSRDLAKAEFDRVQALYAESGIESKSLMDSKETAYNSASDAYDQIEQQLSLFVHRLQEVESSLASSRAMAELARANLDRTQVVAPFDARVTDVSLEANQYVTPGLNVLTLADDSMLEISVSLPSDEWEPWLRFDKAHSVRDQGWFNRLESTPVTISWRQARQNQWTGQLARVERFDAETRMLTVVVRVTGAQAQSPNVGTIPLVEGMFCRIDIPGKTARDVLKVPAEAVAFPLDGSDLYTVYTARKDIEGDTLRLRTRKVRVSHLDGEYAYISEGLDSGDLVITTRLIHPLENVLLDTSDKQGMGG